MFLHSEILSFVELAPVSHSAISTSFPITAALSKGSLAAAFATSEKVTRASRMGSYFYFDLLSPTVN